MLQDGYKIGENNKGGGAIGTAVAGLLIKLLGEVGTVILCIGMAILFIVFMFGIRPAEIISQWMDNAREEREAKEKKEFQEEKKMKR